MDFERKDEDELGFRKNDIVTIISQKDDHCWIGELISQPHLVSQIIMYPYLGTLDAVDGSHYAVIEKLSPY